MEAIVYFVFKFVIALLATCSVFTIGLVIYTLIKYGPPDGPAP